MSILQRIKIFIDLLGGKKPIEIKQSQNEKIYFEF